MRKKVGIALLRAYKDAGPLSLQGPLEDKARNLMRAAILLTATASVKAADVLSKLVPMERIFWRNMVMNRILRGVLWTINNGNAPRRDPSADSRFGGDDRNLECSLSYKVIERLARSPETVYIS